MKEKFIMKRLLFTISLSLAYNLYPCSAKLPSVRIGSNGVEIQHPSILSKEVLEEEVCYTTNDSLWVVKLLDKAKHTQKTPSSWLLWVARQMIGIPYVGGVLDRGADEKLVVDLRHLDCTTFVEQSMALALCAKNKQTTWYDFIHYLSQIRYIDGRVSYVKRQHYFTIWIMANERKGLVRDIQEPRSVFNTQRQVTVNYMSLHQNNYHMLKSHPEWREGIKRMEQQISATTFYYLPKSYITDSFILRQTIRDGDIIAIITSKKGLDTSHIGIAVWKTDGLHLLNASSIHRKVIVEPMLLKNYMLKHPSQLGIRIVRLK